MSLIIGRRHHIKNQKLLQLTKVVKKYIYIYVLNFTTNKKRNWKTRNLINIHKTSKHKNTAQKSPWLIIDPSKYRKEVWSLNFIRNKFFLLIIILNERNLNPPSKKNSSTCCLSFSIFFSWSCIILYFSIEVSVYLTGRPLPILFFRNPGHWNVKYFNDCRVNLHFQSRPINVWGL